MKNITQQQIDTTNQPELDQQENTQLSFNQQADNQELIKEYDDVLFTPQTDSEVTSQNLLKQQAENDNPSSYSLGQLLRLNREKFNWTEEYVASRLHLKKSVIRQLEEDQDVDVSATFLRGYVRAYAKLLGLSEKELLVLLDKNSPKEVTSPKTFQTYVITKKRRRRDGWFKMFSGLVIFTTLGITGAWWWQNYQQDKKELGVMVQQQNSVTMPVTNLVRPTDSAPQTTNQQTIEMPLNITDSTNNQNTISLSPDSALPSLTLPSSNSGSSPIAISQTADPQTAPLSVQQAVVNALPQTNLPTEEAVAESDQKGIGFSFTGDSWLEVVDNKGKVLFSGMKRKDESLNFSEGAPFKLKLGAPATVNLTFDGQSVDLTDYVKTGRVARLTVPSAMTPNSDDTIRQNTVDEPVTE